MPGVQEAAFSVSSMSLFHAQYAMVEPMTVARADEQARCLVLPGVWTSLDSYSELLFYSLGASMGTPDLCTGLHASSAA